MIRIQPNEIADMKAMMEALTIIKPTGEIEICNDLSSSSTNPPLVIEWWSNGSKRGMGVNRNEKGDRVPMVYDIKHGSKRREFSELVVIEH